MRARCRQRNSDEGHQRCLKVYWSYLPSYCFQGNIIGYERRTAVLVLLCPSWCELESARAGFAVGTRILLLCLFAIRRRENFVELVKIRSNYCVANFYFFTARYFKCFFLPASAPKRKIHETHLQVLISSLSTQRTSTTR